VQLARVEGLRAALTGTGEWPRADAAALVRHSYELQLRRAEEGRAQSGGAADAAVVRIATAAQRRRLVTLRADGTIGDAAFQRVEEELDWAELGWDQVLPPEHRAGRKA